MLRLLLNTFWSVTLLALLAAGGGYVWGYARYTGPGPLSMDKLLHVPSGQGVRGIARRLRDEGVVSNVWVFYAAVRTRRVAHRLQAGEYRFPVAINMRDVIDLLVAGKTVVRKLTVPEGLSSAAVVKLIARTEGLVGVAATPAEGSLLPDTYHFSYGDDTAGMIARMTAALDAAMAEMWPGRAPNLPFATPEEAVVLASMVEKETGLAAERPRIAAVFVNRLRKGMKLQSDPTVAYALTLGQRPLDRALTTVDLAFDSPFNTYVISGLQSMPIANPGRDSLRAVLNPMRSRELYFVADGTGGHVFARTFKEHKRNVRRWRKRDKNAATP